MTMVNFTDDALFEKLEQKVELDVGKAWPQIEEATTNNNDTTSGVKQVVILAGPQGSLLHSAHQFFIHHASQYRPNQRAASLSGWVWPWMDPEELDTSFFNVAHDRLFDLMIEHEQNERFIQTLLSEIEDSWTHEASKGIILGSEYFDQVPDSIRVIQRIVDRLEIVDPSQVKILLSYPPSRVAQWNHFYSIATKNSPMSYPEFICDPTFESLNLHRLETSMNPVQLGATFRSYNWSVALLDTKGIVDAQQDLAHVIGCQILSETDCNQSSLNGLQVYPTTIPSSDSNVINDLSSIHLYMLERYFTDRDCFFRNYLLHDDPGFRVLYKNVLWTNCDASPALIDHYSRLTEPAYMWHLVRSQANCKGGEPETTNVTGIPIVNASQIVQQDISRVAASLEEQTISGIKLLSLLCAMVALFVGVVRYRKLRRQNEQPTQEVLRQWNRSNETEPDFSPATISSCVLSPTRYPFREQNIHTIYDEESEMPAFQEIDLTVESMAARGVLS